VGGRRNPQVFLRPYVFQLSIIYQFEKGVVFGVFGLQIKEFWFWYNEMNKLYLQFIRIPLFAGFIICAVLLVGSYPRCWFNKFSAYAD
jgi:hypothetical protein